MKRLLAAVLYILAAQPAFAQSTINARQVIVNGTRLDTAIGLKADQTALTSAITTQANTIAPVADVRSYGAACDGSTDDGGALRSALGAVSSGGVVRLCASSMRVVATSANTSVANVPGGVTVQGVPGKTKLLLDSDQPGASGSAGPYRQFLGMGGANVTLRDFTVTRVAPYAAFVLFPVASYGGLTLNNVIVDCATTTTTVQTSNSYCHGIYLSPSGSISGLVIQGSTFTRMSYGLLMPSATTGTFSNILVDASTFTGNFADDLEFNSPNGNITDVTVRDSVFTANQSTGTGAGFAVGFAHVSRAVVRGGFMRGYSNECVHIEDSSVDITVDTVRMSSCGTTRNAFVQIISGSSRIQVRGNLLDGTSNTDSIALVNVLAGGTGTTPGGRTSIAPSYVSVANNDLLQGTYTNGLYLETVLYPRVTGNTFLGSGAINSGLYGGGVNYGIYSYTGQQTVIANNTFVGVLWGIKPLTIAIQAFGEGSVISGNSFTKCLSALPLLNAQTVTVTGNTFFKNQSTIAIGPGSAGSLSEAISVVGNFAYGSTYPMVLNGTSTIRRAGSTTAAVANGVSLQVTNTDFYMPSGTALSFSGGGTFTLTAAAVVGATSLTGNVTGASIGTSETASYTVALPTGTVVANNGG